MLSGAALLLVWFGAELTAPAALRSACDAEGPVLRELPAGTYVSIRFAITASMSCYKVETRAGESGYVPAALVRGDFERERQAASSLGAVATQIETLKAAIKPAVSSGPLEQAWNLVQANQPRQALDLIEPVLKQHPKRPDALALAGLAAYQADQPRRALDYWEQSLALKADARVERLLERAKREIASDTSADKMHGERVILRFDGAAVPNALASQMVRVLDDELARVSLELGCRPAERITAVVQSPAAYRATTQAAEWTGGMFDGRIHVALPEGPPAGAQVTARTRQIFAHELVHACLASMGPWPAWLHEGLAQRLSGEPFGAAQRAEVEQAIRHGEFPPLGSLGRNWMTLDARRARLAYALAYLASERLAQHPLGVRNLLRNPDQLERVTRDLDRELGLIQ